MAPRSRWFVALTLVVALLSFAGPDRLSEILQGQGQASSAADMAAGAARLISGDTERAPGREQTAPLLGGAIAVDEEDETERHLGGYLLAVLPGTVFEPTRRPPSAALADVLRPVIARGWHALPCGRGPPAA